MLCRHKHVLSVENIKRQHSEWKSLQKQQVSPSPPCTASSTTPVVVTVTPTTTSTTNPPLRPAVVVAVPRHKTTDSKASSTTTSAEPPAQPPPQQQLQLQLQPLSPVMSRTCSLCPMRVDRWICLECGDLACGRRRQAHTTTHTDATGHIFFVNVANQYLFCHKCDNYVSFDDFERELDELYQFLDAEFPRRKKSSNGGSLISDRELKELRMIYVGSDRMRSDGGPARKKFQSITGLANLGNTCFMNSVLQTFCHTSAIKNKLKSPIPSQSKRSKKKNSGNNTISDAKSSLEDSGKEISIFVELENLLAEMWNTSATIVSPISFLDAVWKFVPSFRGYQQQDAQEFIRYLLDRLHTENPSSSISELFYGDFISEVRCLTCNYLSTRRDKFMDLSLPIPDNSLSSTTTSSKTSFTTIGAALSSSSSSRQQPQGISAESSSQHSIYLHDCLKSMLEEEVLGEHDLYNCPKCKSMQRCAKKLTIGHLPHILCLHLKRFKFGNEARSKINTHVNFPMTLLDMNQYLHPSSPTRGNKSSPHHQPSINSSNSKHKYSKHTINKNLPPSSSQSSSSPLVEYDLYSCIVHKGNGSSGHFIAYSWSEEQKGWFEFNDGSAIPIPAQSITNQNAYMLFYVKRDRSSTLTSSSIPISLSSSSSSLEHTLSRTKSAAASVEEEELLDVVNHEDDDDEDDKGMINFDDDGEELSEVGEVVTDDDMTEEDELYKSSAVAAASAAVVEAMKRPPLAPPPHQQTHGHHHHHHRRSTNNSNSSNIYTTSSSSNLRIDTRLFSNETAAKNNNNNNHHHLLLLLQQQQQQQQKRKSLGGSSSISDVRRDSGCTQISGGELNSSSLLLSASLPSSSSLATSSYSSLSSRPYNLRLRSSGGGEGGSSSSSSVFQQQQEQDKEAILVVHHHNASSSFLASAQQYVPASNPMFMDLTMGKKNDASSTASSPFSSLSTLVVSKKRKSLQNLK